MNVYLNTRLLLLLIIHVVVLVRLLLVLLLLLLLILWFSRRLGLLRLGHLAHVCGWVIGASHGALGQARLRWLAWIVLWLLLLHVLWDAALEAAMLLLLGEGADVAEVPPAVGSLGGGVGVVLLVITPVFFLLVLGLEHRFLRVRIVLEVLPSSLGLAKLSVDVADECVTAVRHLVVKLDGDHGCRIDVGHHFAATASVVRVAVLDLLHL